MVVCVEEAARGTLVRLMVVVTVAFLDLRECVMFAVVVLMKKFVCDNQDVVLYGGPDFRLYVRGKASRFPNSSRHSSNVSIQSHFGIGRNSKNIEETGIFRLE